MITSITLVQVPVAEVVTADTVNGWDAGLFRDLFCMHDPVVRDWIRLNRAPNATVIVAGDSWRNDGTHESLTFGIGQRDAEALAGILAELEAQS